MIIKTRSITKSHAANSLAYVIKEEKDHLFLAADGVDISSLSMIMEDFSLYQNPKVKKEFITTVISPSINDQLDTEGLKNLLWAVQEELGLNNRQYYAVVHRNTDTPHIHLISNRIDFDGKTFKDNHIAWKCQTACQNICKKLSLTSAAERRGSYEPKKEKSEFHQSRKRALNELRQSFKDIKFKAVSIDQVFDYLTNKGASIEINQFKNGLLGVSIAYKEFTFKASEIDRLLTLVPSKESYTANPKMQTIIDNNLARMEGRRGSAQILDDLCQYPENHSVYQAEIKAFRVLLSDNSYISAKVEFEEDRQKYLSDKNKKRPKQIGFKIQI